MKRCELFLFLFGVMVLGLALPAAAQDMDGLAGTEWQLVSLGGAPIVEGSAVTLSFGEDDRVSGSAGCNSYGSAYTVNGDQINFSMSISTMMACADAAVNEQESAFLAALGTATSFEMVNGQMVITYGDSMQMVFEPLATLQGTSWQVTAIGGSEASDDLILNFGEDGRAFGDSGCNSFTTTYTEDDGMLSFGPVLSTRAACLGEDSSQQEVAFFSVLESAAGYELSDDQLTITYGDGDTMELTRMANLAGSTWQLESIGGESPVDGTTVTIDFGTNGEVRGNTGCNMYGTSYTVDGDTLSFAENIFTTRRACLSDGAAEQEMAFVDALRGATGFSIEVDQLTITYGNGETLVFSSASTDAQMGSGTVTVEVTYRQRIALPDNAEITVQLLDVSRMDVAAEVLASETITSDGAQVPFTVALSYDPAEIVESNSYAVRAEIRIDGVLTFTTDQNYPVITRGNPNETTIELVSAN